MPESELTRHLAGFTPSGLPSEALRAACVETLWCLGTSLAATDSADARRVRAFATREGVRGAGTILGFGDKVPVAAAGMANGYLAKALEYEDKFWLDYGHAYSIGTGVVPAALAMSEAVGGVDGSTFLTAVALATDGVARLLLCVPGAFDTAGWIPTYLYGSLGAAMAAGVIAGLDEDAFGDALGLAYAQTIGNRQNQREGALGAPLQMGFGVRNGIDAVQAAAAGVSGAKQFLTGPFGLHALFYPDTPVDTAPLTDALGTYFHGVDLGYKAYPCCAATHAALDAVSSAAGQWSGRVEDLSSVVVHGSPKMLHTIEPRERKVDPRNRMEMHFSLPWAAACLLADGSLSVDHFDVAALKVERYRELARRIECHTDAPHGEVRAELVLRDGTRLVSESIGAPRGHMDNPLGLDHIARTYDACVARAAGPLDAERMQRAKELVLGLEAVDDVRQVIELLCPPALDGPAGRLRTATQTPA